MLRLLLASPYPAMRAGLRALLEDTPPLHGRAGVSIMGEAESVAAALAWVRDVRPHLIVYDLAFEQNDDLLGLWQLRAQAPQVPVLALCEAIEDNRMLGALQAGARGCLPKTANGLELLEAATAAAAGENILHPAATAMLLQQLRGETPHPTLTPREVEVLRGVAAGQTNKSIALKLNISEHTVKFHLGAAMSKLGAASRAEAVATALRQGLISI